MKKAIVFDIDGTLADISHRVHYLEGEKKDWDSFYDAMGDDKPIEGVMAILNAFQSYIQNSQTDVTIFAFTGRPEKHREKTLRWLLENVQYPLMTLETILLMRKDGDHRADTIVKKEMLDFIRGHGFEVILAVEDRKRVVDMWRENGITCLQCAEGNF